MKVVIAGTRTFNDYEMLKKACDFLLQSQDEIEIVSGAANGADKLGERYAAEMGYPIKKFPADWEGKGKRAGFIRNSEMAEYADAVIVFWDGLSRGSEMMIKLAKEKGLPTKIYRY